MEEPIEVLEVNITIRSDLSFLTDVKKKFDQPGNEKHKTLFLETKFGIWLDLPAFANDNHLLNYIFHYQVYAEPSVEFPPISYRICCNTFEFGRVCLLLVATIVFMGRETRYNIPDNVLELVDDLPVWNSYPRGEYFWRIFYQRTFNVLHRKNEKDSKKDKDKSVEPPKKKIKVGKDLKKKNKSVEVFPEKMTRYNLYWFVWAVKFIDSLNFLTNGGNSVLKKQENLICGFGDNDSNIQQPDDYDKPNNSYSMNKEDVFGELDAIKATIPIIDNKNGEVSTACLEKQLDLVKDRILVLEKALQQRYQNASKDSVKQACKSDSGVSDVFHQELASEKHQFVGEVQELHPPPKPASLIDNLEASFGSNDMLGPVVEDHINFDTSTKVFQDWVNMMAIEENISDKKFPKTVDVGQLVDFATVQSSPPTNGIGDQNPHPNDMVEYLEPHPTPKQASLIDNVEVIFMIPIIDELRTML
nr:hypothetical protein [Tanacetum cinerariifolium]